MALEPEPTEWRQCPGGLAVDVDHERLVGRCPACAFTFSTLMDEPVVPPHWVAEDGGVVRFRFKPLEPLGGTPLEPVKALEPVYAILTLRCVRGEHEWCERHYEHRHLCQCQCHRPGHAS